MRALDSPSLSSLTIRNTIVAGRQSVARAIAACIRAGIVDGENSQDERAEASAPGFGGSAQALYMVMRAHGDSDERLRHDPKSIQLIRGS